MKQSIAEDIFIKRALLGELSQQEQWEIEEKAFLDTDFFERLQAAEDNLIDDYLYGELTTSEKERFEKHFLSRPERYESLRIARALKRYVSQSERDTPQPLPAGSRLRRWQTSLQVFLRFNGSAFKIYVAASILLIIIIGGVLAVLTLRQKSQPSQEQAKRQNDTPVRPNGGGQTIDNEAQETTSLPDTNGPGHEAQAPTPSDSASDNTQRKPANSGERKDSRRQPVSSSPKAATPIYSFLILPVGPVRGGGSVTTVNLPSRSSIANLQLPLFEETNYRSYRASLQTDERQVIRVWQDLKATGRLSNKQVQVRVPAALLQSQQHYRIALSGILPDGTVREISTYHFQTGR